MCQRSKTPTPLPAPTSSRKISSNSSRRALQSAAAIALFAGSLHAGTQTSLTTMFASDNGSAGNMFDIRATSNCRITGLECNFITGTVDYEIYTTPGSYIGNENSPAAWSLIASGTVVSSGIDLPTLLNTDLDIAIPPGQSLGFYVAVSNSMTIRYTNGPGTGIAAANSELTITEGIGIGYPFGSTYSPRIWNGTVHYDGETGASFCHGDGSGLMCPCGNLGGSERGCGNSAGPGAHLVGEGGASLATNSLRLEVEGMPVNRPGLLIAGSLSVNGGTGAYFGDGLSCVNGSLTTFGVRYSDAGGHVVWDQDILGQAGYAVGSTQYFQVVYRETDFPCGTGYNTSNGLAVTIEP